MSEVSAALAMRYTSILWDADDDPDGNVQHLAEHGLEVEETSNGFWERQPVRGLANRPAGQPFGDSRLTDHTSS